jgi:thioredoxin reductase (NADPH)
MSRSPICRSSSCPAARCCATRAAKPGTGWLARQLAEDRHGFLLTGSDIPAARLEHQNLTPLFLETSRPGIFAVGDVRSGSVKRVAAAIGEGSVAVRLAYERLQSEGTADPIGPVIR